MNDVFAAWLADRNDLTVVSGRRGLVIEHRGVTVETRQRVERIGLLVDIHVAEDAGDLSWLHRWLGLNYPGVRMSDDRTEDDGIIRLRATIREEGIDAETCAVVLGQIVAAALDVPWVSAHPPEFDEWGGWRTGFEDMAYTLAVAGLPVPPVPWHLRPAIARVSHWMWSTSEFEPTELYFAETPAGTDDPASAEAKGVGRDVFTFGHIGHGMNSYFLAYHLRLDGRDVRRRFGYGGIYMNDRSERAGVVEGIERLRQDIDILQQGPIQTPRAAPRRGRSSSPAET